MVKQLASSFLYLKQNNWILVLGIFKEIFLMIPSSAWHYSPINTDKSYE